MVTSSLSRLKAAFFTVSSLAALLIATHSLALEVPRGGPYDKRVKFVDYKAAEVVKIVGHYGFSTHIQFGAGETIEQIAMGDDGA
jgi:type IV secretion system protein VirB9